MRAGALILRIFLRSRLHQVFIAITMLLVVSAVLGAAAAGRVASYYASIKLSRQIPVHLCICREYVVRDLGARGAGAQVVGPLLEGVISNETRLRDAIAGLKFVRWDNLTVSVALSYPLKVRLSTSLAGVERDELNVMLVSQGSIRIRVVEGTFGGLGVLSTIAAAKPGDRLAIYLPAEGGGYAEVWSSKIDYTFEPGLALEAMPLDLALSDPGDLVRLVEALVSGRAPSGIAVFAPELIRIVVIHDIVFDPRAIPCASIDAAISFVEDAVSEISEVGVRTLGEAARIEINEWGFGPLRTVNLEGALVSMTFRGLHLTVCTQPSSRLLEALLTARLLGGMQSASILVSAGLPLLIAAWYLLTIAGGLLADWARRPAALALVRGVDDKALTRGYMISTLASACSGGLLGVLLAYPVAAALVKLVAPEIGLAPGDIITPGTFALGLVLSLVLSLVAMRRVTRYLREVRENLAQLTRAYVPPLREEWRPSKLLTALFIISLVKYASWIAGVSALEVLNWAARHGPLLLLPAILYLVIDSVAGLFAPYVVPYYIIMWLTHSPRVVGWVSDRISRRVVGEAGFAAAGFISRGSARLYRVSFVIALVVSSMIAYVGTASSLRAWLPKFSAWLEEHGAWIGGTPMQAVVAGIEGSVIAYRSAAYLGVLLALLASLLLTLVLLKDMDREIAVQRARGAGIGDVVRFVYGVIFTVLILAVGLGVVCGLIWLRGNIASASFSGLGALGVPEDMPSPELAVPLKDVVLVVAVLLALFLSPLLPLMLGIRAPPAEKLRAGA